MSTNSDVALKFYETAHAEMLARLQMRDRILLTYLAASAAIFGVSTNNPDLVVLIPYLALGMAVAFSHHHMMLGALVEYCGSTLNDHIQKGQDNPVPQFELCLAFEKSAPYALGFSTLAYAFLIVAPQLVAIFSDLDGFFPAKDSSHVASLIFCALSMVVVIYTVGKRKPCKITRH